MAAAAGQAVAEGFREYESYRVGPDIYPRVTDDLPPLPAATSQTFEPATMDVGGQKLHVQEFPARAQLADWVARDAPHSEPIVLDGLSGSSPLATDTAFILRLPRTGLWSVSSAGLWFPVDAVFVSATGRITDVAEVQKAPIAAGPLAAGHNPSMPYNTLLIMRAGSAAQYGMKQGATLGFLASPPDDSAGSTVSSSPSEVLNFARAVVNQMLATKGYRGSGTDVTEEAAATRQVAEQYTYFGPDQVSSQFKVNVTSTASQLIGGGTNLASCADQEVIIIGTTSYQRCLAGPSQGWSRSQLAQAATQTASFRPWVRFAWCETIAEAPAQLLNGIRHRIFTCTIPAASEARLIWDTPEKQQSSQAEIQNFLAHSSSQIAVWVRETDAFIGRFEMLRVQPTSRGSVTQQLDYTFSEFNATGAVRPPF